MKLYYMPGAVEELVLVSVSGAVYCNVNHPYLISKDYSGPYLSMCSWYKKGMSISNQKLTRLYFHRRCVMFRKGQLVVFYLGFYAHMTRDATYRVEDMVVIKTKKYIEPKKLVVVKNNLGQTVAMSALFFKVAGT